MPRHRKIEAMHDFVTKLALRTRMLGSVWYAICPCPSRIIAGSASKAKKWRILSNQNFHKKVPVNFPKKIHFRNHQGVGFRVVCFACFWALRPPPTNCTTPGTVCSSFAIFCRIAQRFSVWRIDLWALPRSDISQLEVEPQVAPVEAPCRQAATFRPVTAPFPPQQRPFRPLRRSFNQKWSPFYLILLFTWLWRHSLEQIWRPSEQKWRQFQASDGAPFPSTKAPFSSVLASFRQKNDALLVRDGALLPDRNHFCLWRRPW